MNNDKQITLEGNGVKFVVAYFPYRKKICLGIQEGNVLSKVATFNDEYSAALFLENMQRLMFLDDDNISEGVKKTIQEMKGTRNG